MKKLSGLPSFLGVLLFGAWLVGCKTQQIAVPAEDAGRKGSTDAYVPPGGQGRDAGPRSADTKPDPILPQQTGSDALANPSDLRKEDATVADLRESDLVELKVDVVGWTMPETLLSPPPDVNFDIRLPIESAPPMTTDAANLPSDVTIHLNRDKGGADSLCVSGTDDWLGVVATFLVEDRKCWADIDCMYVSFTDECGEICPVPMNRQRVGEFGEKVYGSAKRNCATCPTWTDAPHCTPPGSVFCNSGRCEFRP